MADFVATYLDSGRAKRAQDFGAGLNTPIVSVEYGMGNRVADGSETALVQPFNPPIVFAMPAGLVSGETIQTTVNIPEAFRAPNSIDIHEAIYKTTDGTAIFYATRETGAMFTKPGNTGLIVPLVMTFGGDNLTGFTFNSLPVAIADESTAGLVQLGSNAEAIDANPPNTKVGSLRRTLEQTQSWWARTTFNANKITSGIVNILRLPVASNAQLDAATSGSTGMIASVAGVLRMIQRFVPKATEAQYKARADNSVFLTPDSIPAPDVQTFNASGTWRKPDGARLVFVQEWGGGSGSDANYAGGGACGGEYWIAAEALGASESVVVGAGGAAGGRNSGGFSALGGYRMPGGGRPFWTSSNNGFYSALGGGQSMQGANNISGATVIQWRERGGNGVFNGGGGGAGPGGATAGRSNGGAGGPGGGRGGNPNQNGQIPGGGAGSGSRAGARGRVIVTAYF